MCGIKQLQGLRLFVSQTTFTFMVIWEPNNLNLEAKTTFKGATSGTFLYFLQTNIFIVIWFMEPSSFCFEDYV